MYKQILLEAVHKEQLKEGGGVGNWFKCGQLQNMGPSGCPQDSIFFCINYLLFSICTFRATEYNMHGLALMHRSGSHAVLEFVYIIDIKNVFYYFYKKTRFLTFFYFLVATFL